MKLMHPQKTDQEKQAHKLPIPGMKEGTSIHILQPVKDNCIKIFIQMNLTTQITINFLKDINTDTHKNENLIVTFVKETEIIMETFPMRKFQASFTLLVSSSDTSGRSNIYLIQTLSENI